MKNFEKKYQLWTTLDGATYSYQEFDSLQECVQSPKSDPWFITKRVVMSVTDADEQLPVINNASTYERQALPPEIRADEAGDSAVADAYLRGGTGSITTVHTAGNTQ